MTHVSEQDLLVFKHILWVLNSSILPILGFLTQGVNSLHPWFRKDSRSTQEVLSNFDSLLHSRHRLHIRFVKSEFKLARTLQVITQSPSHLLNCETILLTTIFSRRWANSLSRTQQDSTAYHKQTYARTGRCATILRRSTLGEPACSGRASWETESGIPISQGLHHASNLKRNDASFG